LHILRPHWAILESELRLWRRQCSLCGSLTGGMCQLRGLRVAVLETV
jgi:hypothetical protein